ncbi:MAG: hypothetical protein KGL39_49435 [Patescibacteria group bacterium]|nr:hypothetical protein [Patescibacteria group bacterium]
MPEPKPKRVRPRTGYVQVELNPEDRKKLESIAAKLSKETGVKVGLGAACRALIRKEK